MGNQPPSLSDEEPDILDDSDNESEIDGREESRAYSADGSDYGLSRSDIRSDDSEYREILSQSNDGEEDLMETSAWNSPALPLPDKSLDSVGMGQFSPEKSISLDSAYDPDQALADFLNKSSANPGNDRPFASTDSGIAKKDEVEEPSSTNKKSIMTSFDESNPEASSDPLESNEEENSSRLTEVDPDVESIGHSPAGISTPILPLQGQADEGISVEGIPQSIRDTSPLGEFGNESNCQDDIVSSTPNDNFDTYSSAPSWITPSVESDVQYDDFLMEDSKEPRQGNGTDVNPHKQTNGAGERTAHDQEEGESIMSLKQSENNASTDSPLPFKNLHGAQKETNSVHSPEDDSQDNYSKNRALMVANNATPVSSQDEEEVLADALVHKDDAGFVDDDEAGSISSFIDGVSDTVSEDHIPVTAPAYMNQEASLEKNTETDTDVRNENRSVELSARNDAPSDISSSEENTSNTIGSIDVTTVQKLTIIVSDEETCMESSVENGTVHSEADCCSSVVSSKDYPTDGVKDAVLDNSGGNGSVDYHSQDEEQVSSNHISTGSQGHLQDTEDASSFYSSKGVRVLVHEEEDGSISLVANEREVEISFHEGIDIQDLDDHDEGQENSNSVNGKDTEVSSHEDADVKDADVNQEEESSSVSLVDNEQNAEVSSLKEADTKDDVVRDEEDGSSVSLVDNDKDTKVSSHEDADVKEAVVRDEEDGSSVSLVEIKTNFDTSSQEEADVNGEEEGSSVSLVGKEQDAEVSCYDEANVNDEVLRDEEEGGSVSLVVNEGEGGSVSVVDNEQDAEVSCHEEADVKDEVVRDEEDGSSVSMVDNEQDAEVSCHEEADVKDEVVRDEEDGSSVSLVDNKQDAEVSCHEEADVKDDVVRDEKEGGSISLVEIKTDVHTSSQEEADVKDADYEGKEEGSCISVIEQDAEVSSHEEGDAKGDVVRDDEECASLSMVNNKKGAEVSSHEEGLDVRDEVEGSSISFVETKTDFDISSQEEVDVKDADYQEKEEGSCISVIEQDAETSSHDEASVKGVDDNEEECGSISMVDNEQDAKMSFHDNKADVKSDDVQEEEHTSVPLMANELETRDDCSFSLQNSAGTHSHEETDTREHPEKFQGTLDTTECNQVSMKVDNSLLPIPDTMDTVKVECEAVSKTIMVDSGNKVTDHLEDTNKRIGRRWKKEELDILGVSVHYLQNAFLQEVRDANLDEKASMYDIDLIGLVGSETGITRGKGENFVCPVDGGKGAAYILSRLDPHDDYESIEHTMNIDLVDADNTDDVKGTNEDGVYNVGVAEIAIGYTWNCSIGQIIDTLVEYCASNNLDLKRTYVWMRSLCTNLHRPSETNGQVIEETFMTRFTKIGHYLAVMTPWHSPDLFHCALPMYEMFLASKAGCKITITMPQVEKSRFIQAIENNNESEGKLKRLSEVLSNTRIQYANTADIYDLPTILGIIEDGPGYELLNKTVNRIVRDWVIDLGLDEVEMRRKIVGGSHKARVDFAGFLIRVGYLLQSIEETNLAVGLCEEALLIYESCYGRNHVTTATAINNIAFAMRAQGNLDEALKMFKEVLAICESLHGRNHAHTATALNNIGLVLRSLGKLDEALQMLMEALKIKKALRGANHTDTARSLNNVAGLLRSQGKFKESLKLYQEALVVRKKVLGAKHPSSLSTRKRMASVSKHLSE